MHTLRYVLGDNVFFPTLKKLATDPQYTYSNFVTTDNVEKLFSNESGKNLKPLFDFYLRTIKKLDIVIKQTGFHQYYVVCKNAPMALDVDVLTDGGTQRTALSERGVRISSNFTPVIDARGYYLKTVVSD